MDGQGMDRLLNTVRWIHLLQHEENQSKTAKLNDVSVSSVKLCRENLLTENQLDLNQEKSTPV